MAQIKGEVRKIWAQGLRDHIEKHNYPRGQRLEKKITFANLGGLAIWFWEAQDVFHQDPEIARLEEAKLILSRSAINLRFDDVPMLVTTTSRIRAAAIEKNGNQAPLAMQLRKRMNPPLPYGYDPNDVVLRTQYRSDEIWLFPAHQVIELERREQ